MTQTLTTDLVDATPDEWFEALSQSPDLCAGLTVDVIQRMAARLAKLMRAANREAQPVGYIAEVSGNRVGVLRGLPMPDVGSLIYTAPPAPAVVNGRTAEGWMAEALLQKKIADDVRKSAPAVPDAISTRQAIANMERHELSGSINVAYKHGWNDFRAAMLAQPVSQGYKLVPVEPTEEMLAAAMNCDDVEFNSDETFCVNFDNIYRAMLAAAPEGGNG